MASVLEISGIVFGLFITIKYFNLIGVTAAAISFLTGRTFANLYLHKHYSKIVNVKKQ
jgi:hypothetical protein